MPKKAKFKPGFVEDTPKARVIPCSISGCILPGEYKAPKSNKRLDDYQWLCLDHIREFNKAWDYFRGLSEDEILDFQKDALTGHRPTWKFGIGQKKPEEIMEAFFRDFMGDPEFKKDLTTRDNRKVTPKERKALDVLGLDTHVAISELKKQYKLLVKQHHPDVNSSNPGAEEKFKRIQEAYNFLKKQYEA